MKRTTAFDPETLLLAFDAMLEDLLKADEDATLHAADMVLMHKLVLRGIAVLKSECHEREDHLGALRGKLDDIRDV